MKKIFVFLILLLIVSFSTKAFASLTFTTDAITGTTASTIDLGAGNNLFLQTSGGNVGIGTTAPTSPLSISFNSSDPFFVGASLSNADIAGASTYAAINSTGKAISLSVFGASFIIPDLANIAVLSGTGGFTLMTNSLTASGGTDPLTFRIGGYAATNEKMRITSTGRVGIGTTVPLGVLDITSTTAGFLPPRMTTTQRNALTPVEGLTVYDLTLHKLYVYDGTTWQAAW